MDNKFLPGDLVSISRGNSNGMIIQYLGIKKIRTGLTRFNSHHVYLVQNFKNSQLQELPVYMLGLL